MRSVRTIAALKDPIYELLLVTSRDRWWLGAALAFAASAHSAFGWMVSHRLNSRPPLNAAITSEFIDIDLPPPAKEPTPPDSPPGAASAPKVRNRALRAIHEPVPSELAQAAAALTKRDDLNDTVDLTGFVSGTATAYAGGTTASMGTSTSSINGRADITGNGKSTGTAGSIPTVDQSRPPGVVGDTNWNCPFPLEAEVDRISSAIATIRVAVDAANRIISVEVLQDPTHGFGDAARDCAMAKSWRAARNREGTSIAGSVIVRIHFVR
jgi:protein TonB